MSAHRPRSSPDQGRVVHTASVVTQAACASVLLLVFCESPIKETGYSCLLPALLKFHLKCQSLVVLMELQRRRQQACISFFPEHRLFHGAITPACNHQRSTPGSEQSQVTCLVKHSCSCCTLLQHQVIKSNPCLLLLLLLCYCCCCCLQAVPQECPACRAPQHIRHRLDQGCRWS